jgi:hypothetical protein
MVMFRKEDPSPLLRDIGIITLSLREIQEQLSILILIKKAEPSNKILNQTMASSVRGKKNE